MSNDQKSKTTKPSKDFWVMLIVAIVAVVILTAIKGGEARQRKEAFYENISESYGR